MLPEAASLYHWTCRINENCNFLFCLPNYSNHEQRPGSNLGSVYSTFGKQMTFAIIPKRQNNEQCVCSPTFKTCHND